jgi:hypothetical protein
VGLHQAPRFHAYFRHLLGRQVLLMARVEWEELKRAIQPGELVRIDLRPTPLASVMSGSSVLAVVAERLSPSEVVIEVYRNDPKDAPTLIHRDTYRAWEQLPAHLDSRTMVISASTEDNANMRGFIDDHVFLTRDDISDGHWLSELPERVRAVLRSQ